MIHTAREAAIHLIQNYVKRGDSYESIKNSFMGRSCSSYNASIGGYINRKWISSKFIIVTQLNNKDINPKIFELRELFYGIKNNTIVVNPLINRQPYEVHTQQLLF